MAKDYVSVYRSLVEKQTKFIKAPSLAPRVLADARLAGGVHAD
jgi:hypothetical protein